MEFALSTSWNAFRHKSGKEMLFEIIKLGFDRVELSFNLEKPMISQIELLVKDGTIRVSSVHNYCPVPETLPREEALPDSYSLSSLNEEERKIALKYTKRSIDTAASLGAKAVVLHCGRVEAKDRTRELIGLFDRANPGSKEFLALRDQALKERSLSSASFFQKTLFSLDELNSYASKKSVLLGVETRFYLREIPSFEEVGLILDKFEGSNIYYWHDTGHAQVMENLQICAQLDFLKQYARSMIGVHLHDVSLCRDHLAPGSAELDFSIFKPYLKPDTVKVIEAHYPAKPEELQKARKILDEALK